MRYKPSILPLAANDVPPAGLSKEWADKWTRVIRAARKKDLSRSRRNTEAFWARVQALSAHFGINPKDPSASRDLALNLVRRHEKANLVHEGRACIGRIFESYRVDLSEPEADFKLALELAIAHIPGFKYRHPEPRRRRLNDAEFIEFLVAVAKIDTCIKKTSIGKSSNRYIAKLMVDPKHAEELRNILGETEAASLQKLVKGKGNARRASPGALSEKTVRNYLHDIQTVGAAISAGTVNAFQWQLIEVTANIFSYPINWANPPVHRRHNNRS